jgi:hypothetical protein
VRPIPHRLHAAGKRKIPRQLEEPVFVLSCTSVSAADMDDDGSTGNLEMARGGTGDARPKTAFRQRSWFVSVTLTVIPGLFAEGQRKTCGENLTEVDLVESQQGWLIFSELY